MRRWAWVLLVGVMAGCRGDDVARPEFRRPLEDLPAGAETLLLGSDLRNMWQRAEGHELWEFARQFATVERFLQRADVSALQTACRRFETRTGTRVQDDLLLNALGSRATLGAYGVGSAAGEFDPERMDLLLVGELADPGRFRSAIRALRPEDFEGQVEISESSVGEAGALRFERAGGRSIVIVQQDNFLVASTRDSLALGALAIHAGASRESALGDSAFAAALRALGPANVMALTRTPGEAGHWVAQGFTWDPEGLRLGWVRPAGSDGRGGAEEARSGGESAGAAPGAEGGESRREDILRSIPDGMTLALYGRGSALGLANLGGAGARHMAGADSAVGQASSILKLATSFLPPEVWRVAGDEFGIALLDAETTALAAFPNVGLVLELRDPESAARSLRVLEAALNIVRFQGVTHDFEDVAYGGRTFRSLVNPLLGALTPSWIVDGDFAIITSTRALMQQFVDTRRTGRRNVLSDGSFRPFRDFVPAQAQAVVYADRRRLQRVLDQIQPSLSRLGAGSNELVTQLQRFAVLGDHFPAGVAYLAPEGDRLAVRGWVMEKK